MILNTLAYVIKVDRRCDELLAKFAAFPRTTAHASDPCFIMLSYSLFVKSFKNITRSKAACSFTTLKGIFYQQICVLVLARVQKSGHWDYVCSILTLKIFNGWLEVQL